MSDNSAWANSKTRRIKRAFKNIRNMGLVQGLGYMTKVAQPPGSVVAVNLPKYPAPIYLRAATSDVFTFEKIFIEGEYALYRDITPKCIVDAGANVGYASLFFTQRFPDAQIVSIEPDESNFEMLCKNTEPYKNIRPVKSALWPRSTFLSLTNPSGSPDSFVVQESSTNIPGSVQALTITELLDSIGEQRIDILKIDIESAEKELFGSDTDKWLDKVGLIMIELHDWIKPGCAESFYRAITSRHFTQHVHGETIIITFQ